MSTLHVGTDTSLSFIQSWSQILFILYWLKFSGNAFHLLCNLQAHIKARPFPHRAWAGIHLCSLPLSINEVLYVLKTVNIMKSSCETHLQLASTFPVGSSGLGLCYHVSSPVLRQPSNSSEISYKGNQDDQWEFCQEHQSLLNGSVLRTANTQTRRKEDSSENGTMKVKKNWRKKKKNDAQEIIFFKSRRLIIDRCMYSQSKAEFKMQKAQSMACNTNPQEHLSTHPTLNILLNWSEQNPCLTTLLFVLTGETWDNPKMLSFETFQIIKLHIGDSVSVAVYIYRKCRIKSYFYLLIP